MVIRLCHPENYLYNPSLSGKPVGGQTMTLIICEKDNAARRIAEILSEKRYTKENYKRVPYYTYSQKGSENTVVGLRGHIINLDYAAEYNQWRKVIEFFILCLGIITLFVTTIFNGRAKPSSYRFLQTLLP